MDLIAVQTIAMTFFIIANPIGNSPAILTLIKEFPIKKQRYILFRECALSLLLAFFFQYLGQHFLDLMMLTDYSLAICGGVLLLLIGLNLIFPNHSKSAVAENRREPFFVPIATPLLAGPGLLTIVMLYAKQDHGSLSVSLGLLIAWAGITLVLQVTPYLQKLLGNRGIMALEQLMGMVLTMISIEMLLTGLRLFLKHIHGGSE